MSALAEQFLAGTRTEFERLKAAADGALEQVGDEDFFRTIDAETNSIAVLVKHMAGNLQSRWTDFLSSDGEKPDRDRDAEFVVGAEETRAALIAGWEAGWARLFEALGALRPEDVGASVEVRSERMSVIDATQRQLAHAAGHIGQIILLARHFRGASWRTLTVPRGESRAYTEAVRRAARGVQNAGA